MTIMMNIYILNYYVFFPDFRSTKFQNQMLNQANKDNDITKESFLFN